MLSRVTRSSWKDIQAQWRQECVDLGENFDSFSPFAMAHVEKILLEDPPNPRYGIFSFSRSGQCDAIMHANSNIWPTTHGKILRIVWIFLSPRFDYEERDLAEIASVASGVISGAVALARSAEMTSQHIQLRMGTAFDRTMIASVGAVLGTMSGITMKIRGSWVYLDGLGAP
ncbi:hypothetical protein [Plastoroseomonas arctica]|uniref:Uncharacterized protein n=1 Tax=Plastoroseomonas arctica TaxID=1509237 RepID=A0AAF1K0A5_9PROT|nr:hypothetical protein [Plastoroseomonas arctica]MBR0654783.1 hypothetical protein [Plastoroseomonas arctica]